MSDEFSQWFIGLDVPTAPAKELATLAQKLATAPGAPKAAWMAATSLHVPLVYVGHGPLLVRNALMAVLAQIGRRHDHLTVCLGVVTAAPSLELARIVCAQVDGGEALVRLAAAVNEAVVDLGFAVPARKFSPHITLARLATDAAVGSWLAATNTALVGQWQAGSVALFEKRRGGYEVVGRVELKDVAPVTPPLALELELIQTDDGWPKGHIPEADAI